MFANRLRFPSFMYAALACCLPAADIASGAILAQWTFNEGSGTTAFDSSGNGLHGSVEGGAQYVETAGGFGLSLDGVDDHVNFGQPATLDFTTQAFTIEAWVSVTAAQSFGNLHYIIGKNDTSWSLGYEDGNPAGSATRWNSRINTENGLSAPEGPVGGALPFGTMFHILVTKGACDGPGCGTDPVQFYINGQGIPNPCCGVNDWGGRNRVVSQAVDVNAGKRGDQFFHCIIDEITIHDVRMNPSQAGDRFTADPQEIPTIEISQSVFPNSFSLCVTGEVGIVYTLQAASAADGPYSDLGLPVPGNGGNLYFFDTSAAGSAAKFYRVRTQP